VAAPNPAGKPGRTLTLFLVVVAALAAWTFWPGTTNGVKLGLDLRGGTQVILTPNVTDAEAAEITQDQLDQAVNIIRQRVDGFGVAEAEVTTQGSGAGAAIVVSVPGELSQEQQDAIASTAKLDFRPVLQADVGAPVATPTATPSASPSGSPSGSPSPTKTKKKDKKDTASPSPTGNGAALTGGIAPAADSASPTASPTASPAASPSASGDSDAVLPPIQSKDNDDALQAKYAALDCTAKDALTGGKPVSATEYLATCQDDGSAKFLLEPATVLGTQITGAQAQPPQQGVGGWTVNLSFNSDGAAAFLQTTTTLSQQQDPQNRFGIVLDGLVVSAHSVSAPIPGGQAEISGSFTQAEATSLANVLKYGALPVTLQVASVDQVSPTLGQDQLNAGLIAGGLGVLLVVAYLLLYYRALGLVAVASLAVAGAITYFIFVILGRQLGLSLSLAGVAGAIVAIGITADSFIIYFERIRDEVRHGRTLRAACEAGWVSARRTLLAADFVSFLAAAVLYFVSVGNVRGFAFVLGLTTIVDVAMTFWFTRPLVALLAGSAWFSRGSKMTGISADRMGHADPLDQPPPRPRTPARAGSGRKGA
jgi:preprotein translocase subunit SecD